MRHFASVNDKGKALLPAGITHYESSLWQGSLMTPVQPREGRGLGLSVLMTGSFGPAGELVIIELQNAVSWKGPTKITESNSVDHCPNEF